MLDVDERQAFENSNDISLVFLDYQEEYPGKHQECLIILEDHDFFDENDSTYLYKSHRYVQKHLYEFSMEFHEKDFDMLSRNQPHHPY